MKVIFDFDGTLTNIQYESRLVMEAFNRRALEACGNREDVWNLVLQSAVQEVELFPECHGWLHKSRMTEFADEDLFAKMLGITQCLDAWLLTIDARIEPYVSCIPEADLKSFSFRQLINEAYDEMNAAPLCDECCIEPEAVACIEKLLSRQYEVVIVSNSKSARIIEKLEYSGLKPVWHNDNHSAQFRVRGYSRKYILDEEPNIQKFGKRHIDVSRSAYQEIIEDERPMAIVGDIFSLDLALPLYLSRCEPLLYDEMQLYLRLRSYTPEWAKEAMRHPDPECMASPRFLENMADLTELMRKHYY